MIHARKIDCTETWCVMIKKNLKTKQIKIKRKQGQTSRVRIIEGNFAEIHGTFLLVWF